MTKEDYLKLKKTYPSELFIPMGDRTIVVIYKGRKSKSVDDYITEFIHDKYDKGELKESKYKNMFVFIDPDLCREIASSRPYIYHNIKNRQANKKR